MSAPCTFYSVVGGADAYWRVTNPAKQIGAKLCLIREEEKDCLLHQGMSPLNWSSPDDGPFVYPGHEGAAVWTRPCKIRARHALAMQELGHLTVAEVDDNYLSPTHLNLFMRVNRYGPQARRSHLEAMACFDRVVCSTEWLAETYRRAFKKELGHVPEMFVCRNNADLDDWPDRAEAAGPLRVGWMGSPQHARDIKLAFRAFAWARAQGHDVVLMGHDVRDETGVTHPRAREACRAWRSVITRHIPWVDPEEYHRTALPFDIGLAPLELNEHTMGKSDVKALEIAMSGAVPVLQSHPVYTKHWKHNETCLLAGSPVEFEHAVRELARSRSLRERLVSAAQAYVREERSNEQTRREWGEAIGG